MKVMKWLRYPLLFIAIIFIPISLTIIMLDVPIWIGLPSPYTWSFLFGIIGYFLGYFLINGFMNAVNHSFHLRVYSDRMRTTYLIANSIISLLLLYMLSLSTSLLFGNQTLMFWQGLLFIGFPWVGVQMLLLLFFVRSERLYR